MTQTNLIDTTKFDALPPKKANGAVEHSGDTDFASELNASSLMLNFFEVSSRLSSSGSGVKVPAALERLSEDKSFENKEIDRERQFLREVKEGFEEARRASQVEKNNPFSEKISKAGAKNDLNPSNADEDSVDNDRSTTSKLTSKVEEQKPGLSEERRAREASGNKESQGKVSSGAPAKGEAKILNNEGAVATKDLGGEKLEILKPLSFKELTSLNASLETSPAESAKGQSLGLSNTLNPTAQGALNSSLPAPLSTSTLTLPSKGSAVAQLSVTPTTSGGGAGVTSAQSLQSSVHAKAVPIAKSSNFDSFLLRQVASKVAVTFKNNLSTAKLTLNPPELGKLRVEIITEGTKVKATIATENVLVRDSLEANVALLRQSLIEQGLNVSDITIVLLDGSGNYDKATGNWAGRRGAGNKSKDQDVPVEELQTLKPLDNDTLDIFI